jgi:hypothetical protein
VYHALARGCHGWILTIDAPFQRFSLGASMIPEPSFVWISSMASTHSWPESVEEGGVSGGGRGLELWMLGCLGGEAVEFWRSPSGFGELERRERVGRSTKKEGARGDRRNTAAGLVSWMCALRCPRPAICSLPLFQASRAGFPRPKQPERDSKMARGPWLRLQRRSTMRTTWAGLASSGMQEWGGRGRERRRGVVNVCAQRAHNK